MSAPHEIHGFSPLSNRSYDGRYVAPYQLSLTRDEYSQEDKEMGQEPRRTLNPVQNSVEDHSSPFIDPPQHNEEKIYIVEPTNDSKTLETDAYSEYKENSSKQLRYILITGIGGWAITMLLCYSYYVTIAYWQTKSPVSKFQKRLFNAVSTAISIALGLNISSALKNIALNMRWPILASKKRNLIETELLLNADSLKELVKLSLATTRSRLIFGCLAWMLINIINQIGIAALSLTYNFDQDMEHALWKEGTGNIPALDHFYPQINLPSFSQTVPDEEYTAHMYGEIGFKNGIGAAGSQPSPGKIYAQTDPMLYVDPNRKFAEFFFFDTPEGYSLDGPLSAFTDRKINVTHECDAFHVLKGGDGRDNIITVETIGAVNITHSVPSSTAFLTRKDNSCEGNPRCLIVEVFESSLTNPWYYVCNVSFGQTQNDPENITPISNFMAQIAIGSIAQIGFKDSNGLALQIYPRDSPWGQAANGDPDQIGITIAVFSLSAILGSARYNPPIKYTGTVPTPGFALKVNHERYFYGIMAMICSFHFISVIVWAILSNRVKVQLGGPISISRLLAPLDESLSRVKGKTLREVKQQTFVRYTKDPHREGQWYFKRYAD
ncbi:hypothetical protein K3495_g11472 [Podosphaera aphanis]|nr:hypothetical protein K3495_g11472 [Podosphaera aphanis]